MERNNKLPVTVLIAVKNEAVNLPRCLVNLTWAEKIILLDSHSTDGTIEIAATAGIEAVQFDYKGGYPKKRQWALDNLNFDTPWIFLLDADEVVPDALWQEIADVIKRNDVCDAYMIVKQFHFMGRSFRFGGFSHSAVLLFKNGKARFEHIFDDSPDGLDMEVHERLIVNGKTGHLKTPLIHEDFKGLEAYIARHNKYSTWEAKLRYHYLKTGHYGKDTIMPKLFGNSQERRRFFKAIAVKIPFEPLLWFIYHYIIRLGFLEGKAGFIASSIRANYIFQVRSKIYELEMKHFSAFQEKTCS